MSIYGSSNAFITLQTVRRSRFIAFQAFGNSGVSILNGPSLATFISAWPRVPHLRPPGSSSARNSSTRSITQIWYPWNDLGSGFGQILTTATPPVDQFG